MKYFLFYTLSFFAITIGAQNQLDLSYYLPKDVSYNSEIPTPESVIGHQIGEWHVTHDKLVEYMKTLASSSNRITLEDRGKTFEDRSLLLLTITSPENHQNLERIQSEHLSITDSSNSNNLDLNNMPLVVLEGFSVHGNEPSGANASLILAYYLAAAQGPEVEQLLKHTIILLDPSLNPDGLQRFAYWANTNKSENLNPDSNDREFHEVWPGGRTNHYWFDMNRDYLPAQLPETKVRIETFYKWMPNIVTDHHEMGTNSTFFFQPGVQSRVHPLTPKANQKLTKEIGNYHAEALNKIGSLYFTEERYDDYNYGKGSTFPDLNGSVGILFEQASSRGHAQESINGVLTFPFTIKNQFTVALSTLEAARDMRVKLLNYQRDFFIDSQKKQRKEPIKAIVFGDEKDFAKTYHLAEILNRHKIRLHKLKLDYKTNNKVFKKESSFIVPTNQKNTKLIKAMFEKRTNFTDSLFYDISAWTFPLAFNINYEELESTSQIGDLVKTLKMNNGYVSNKSSFAYLMVWNEYYTPKALNAILKRGIRAKVGMKPFSLNGKQYDYGTILIPVQKQILDESKLYTFLQKVAANSNLIIDGVDTGLTNGIDLGSNQFKKIGLPKVAMIVGRGINAYDAGEIWHLFDQRYEMNVSRLDVDYLNRVDFSKYTTIILPSTKIKMNEKTVEKLKAWVQNGGVFIGYKNSVKWLAANKFMKLEFSEAKLKAKHIAFGQRTEFTGSQLIKGSIFETILDRSHPINFGFKNDKLPVFRQTKIIIKPDSNSFNNPIRYTKDPLLSGYVSKENLNLLRNMVPFQVKPLGKGKVIAFTDNTNFRGFWYGTNKLLMNAVFFAKSM